MSVRVMSTKGGATMWPFGTFAESHEGTVIETTPNLPEEQVQSQSVHFADCILNGTPPIAPFEHGLIMLRMLDAQYRSSELGADVTL